VWQTPSECGVLHICWIPCTLQSIENTDLHHCFGVVSVGVQDRDSQAPCNVGAVRTGPPIARGCGEADLHHMQEVGCRTF
jgi:hypothetical protein